MGEAGALTRLGSGATALTKPKGALGALVKRGSSLPAEDRARLDALTLRADANLEKRAEVMGSGIEAEIAPDFSASTGELHGTLTSVSSSLGDRLIGSMPGTRLSYGVFGGADLVRTGQSRAVLGSEHVATNGWQSSFSTYLKEYGARLLKGRHNVLVTFHDAQARADSMLREGINLVNENGATVFVVYLPSSGSSDADKIPLRDMCDEKLGGFSRGIFIDLSGVGHKDAAALESLLQGLIEAVNQANTEARKEAGGNMEIAGVSAAVKLRNLVGGVVKRTLGNKGTKLLNG